MREGSAYKGGGSATVFPCLVFRTALVIYLVVVFQTYPAQGPLGGQVDYEAGHHTEDAHTQVGHGQVHQEKVGGSSHLPVFQHDKHHQHITCNTRQNEKV